VREREGTWDIGAVSGAAGRQPSRKLSQWWIQNGCIVELHSDIRAVLAVSHHPATSGPPAAAASTAGSSNRAWRPGTWFGRIVASEIEASIPWVNMV
jgi:hypothetical protein